MAYSITKQSDNHAYGYAEFVINTRDDKDNLPLDVAPGSNCLCLEDSSVWVLSVNEDIESREWKEI